MKLADVSKVPTELPEGFEWAPIDIKNDESIDEVVTLLRENYVEDTEAIFRFDYPKELIRWVLDVPSMNKDWHIGVRAVKSKKLLGFISGTPTKTQIEEQCINMASVNFLCVHKKLRNKKLAPTLIKEMTRRVNLTGVWQATYTSGDLLPTPFSKAMYYHRSLNPKKLVETGFSALPRNTPLSRYCKMFKTPELSQINLIGTPRLMQEKDIPTVYGLYKKMCKRFKVYFRYTQEELGHQLMPIDGIVYTIVIESQKGEVTDFISFYNLPS